VVLGWVEVLALRARLGRAAERQGAQANERDDDAVEEGAELRRRQLLSRKLAEGHA